MISSVRGQVLSRGLQSAVIEVGGVGFTVSATPTTLSELRSGEEALLHTAFIVKEDSMSLYGFLSTDERDTFNALLSISGIGAKIALAVLSVHTPDSLRSAVSSQSIAALTQVPGIGKKGAQRMLLELGNKLGPASGEQVEAASASSSTVVEALMGLGWNESDAGKAVALVESEQGVLPTAQMLRAALGVLGRK